MTWKGPCNIKPKIDYWSNLWITAEEVSKTSGKKMKGKS